MSDSIKSLLISQRKHSSVLTMEMYHKFARYHFLLEVTEARKNQLGESHIDCFLLDYLLVSKYLK